MNREVDRGPELEREPMVTEVRIRRTRRPPILAFASITLWGAFAVHDVRVLRRQDGSYAVLMPRHRGPDGTWTTVAHPIDELTRREIEARVLDAYEKLLAGTVRPHARAESPSG